LVSILYYPEDGGRKLESLVPVHYLRAIYHMTGIFINSVGTSNLTKKYVSIGELKVDEEDLNLLLNMALR